MPNYDWRCQVCDSVNPDSSITCNSCGCPAEVNAYEIERRKKGLGSSESLIVPNTVAPGGPLPLSGVIKDTLIIVWDNRLRLAQALIIASVALVSLEMVFVYQFAPKPSWFLNALYTFFYTMLGTIFAVTCHRIVLLGSTAVPKYGILSWTKREIRFLGWTIVGYLFFTLITMLVGTLTIPIMAPGSSTKLTFVIWLAVLLPGGYVLSRLSILLPATAVDERPNLKWAWNITSGNGWKIFFIVLLLPQILASVYVFIDWPEHLIIQIILSLLGCVVLAIGIAALSVSYRYLTRK